MDELQGLIDEYELLKAKRTKLKPILYGLPAEGKVGDVAWDYETKLLYVCAGRLNGRAVWKRAY